MKQYMWRILNPEQEEFVTVLLGAIGVTYSKAVPILLKIERGQKLDEKEIRYVHMAVLDSEWTCYGTSRINEIAKQISKHLELMKAQ